MIHKDQSKTLNKIGYGYLFLCVSMILLIVGTVIASFGTTFDLVFGGTLIALAIANTIGVFYMLGSK